MCPTKTYLSGQTLQALSAAATDLWIWYPCRALISPERTVSMLIGVIKDSSVLHLTAFAQWKSLKSPNNAPSKSRLDAMGIGVGRSKTSCTCIAQTQLMIMTITMLMTLLHRVHIESVKTEPSHLCILVRRAWNCFQTKTFYWCIRGCLHALWCGWIEYWLSRQSSMGCSQSCSTTMEWYPSNQNLIVMRANLKSWNWMLSARQERYSKNILTYADISITHLTMFTWSSNMP